MAEFRIERLQKQKRAKFDCGVEALNRFLVRQAGQEMRRRYSVCYVLIEISSGEIAGYYTLSAGSILLLDLPGELSRQLPRYPHIPVARVGRLAVDRRFQSRGLGGVLLFDAIQRVVHSEISVFAIVVDAQDDAAAQFYERHGFLRLRSLPKALFLPMSNALRSL